MLCRLGLVGVVAGALASGCSAAIGADPGLEGLTVDKVAPDTIIPGTKLVVSGASFVDAMWGDATLRLQGTAGGSSVDVSWPATFVDFSTMTVAIDGSKIDEIGGEVGFDGTATVEIVATSDGNTYKSDPLDVTLTFAESLSPTVTGLDNGGVIFVNEKIGVQGAGFLLGGDEGTSIARIAGCFTLDTGGACTPITAQEIPLVPTDPVRRDSATFAFSPKVAGIKPGTFTGTVTIVNQQTAKPPQMASATNVTYTMVSPQIFTVCVGEPCTATVAASLGQYVFVQGGGFIGGDASQTTELELRGTFQRTGSNPAPVTMTLIPDFVEGSLVRYVLNTDDALGMALDLRQDTGTFTGTITPIIQYGATRVGGASKSLSFAIAPVKQVVYLDFRPSYVEGLRDFGMRAVDNKLRARIIEVCKRAYKGINIEFRLAPPTDFALYEHVEITGVDPNNMGLFGYDNSPGKDNGNMRLYDRLGGVNALTQQDGYPGFGGVFLRSLLGFSKHPGNFTKSVPGADVVFDQIFDPFRPDQGGEPVRAADLAGVVETLTSGEMCPASERPDRVACAIFVLGNLVGGTLSHEIGHSLGLANPYQEGFHNAGDGVNRLMDSGGDRPFFERAELEGQGPGVFCDDEYQYLRMVLPSQDPSNDVPRPGCF